MNGGSKRLVAAVLAVGVTVAVAALSQIPYGPAEQEEAVLRLSWRAGIPAIETCRTLTREEIERRPVHMRQERECERHTLSYRLHVAVDGEILIEDTVPGRRADRPISHFSERPLPPGASVLSVIWAPVYPPEYTPDAEEALTLRARVRAQPGDVTLVTYDRDDRLLTARGPGVRGVRAERSERDPPALDWRP